jgi:Tfp pilus assembly protein PilO
MLVTAFRRLAGEIVPILVFSCAALGALAVMRAVVVPQWRCLRDLSGDVSRHRALASDTSRLREITAQLLDKKEKLVRQCALVAPRQAGPPSADLSGILQLLITRAKEADIRFVKMEPIEETQHKGLGEYPVVLQMTTSYQSLGRLVSSLEELPRQLSVGRVAITAVKNGLDVRILVTCFLKKAG